MLFEYAAGLGEAGASNRMCTTGPAFRFVDSQISTTMEALIRSASGLADPG